MSGAITTYRGDMSVIMDGSTVGGVFLEVLRIDGGTSGSKSYPRVIGGSMFAFVLQPGNNAVSIDTNGSGQGRINWGPSPGGGGLPTVLAVFARRLLAPGRKGMTAYNASNDVIIDSEYPVPQFIGKVQLTASDVAPRVLPSGYVEYVYWARREQVAAVGATYSDRIVMMAMPDSGADDIWYSLGTGYIPGGDTLSGVGLSIYAPPNTAFQAPSVYIFSLNQPTSATPVRGLRVLDLAQSVVYNSASENLNVRDFLNITVPPIGSTNSYGASFTATSGVALPPYEKTIPHAGGPGSDKYVQAFRRSGSQLTNKLILTGSNQGSSAITSEIGVTANAYCPVLNLAPYGYAVATVPVSGPTITQQPLGTTGSQEGDNVGFSVRATGTGPITYQWRRNGANIAGATAQDYVRTMGPNDFTGDSFTCLVSNPAGSVLSNAATIVVTHPGGGGSTAPTILSSPADTNVPDGTAVTLNVSASGNPSPSYQWQVNYVDIPGANSPSYSFTATLAMNGNLYRCFAINSVASVPSTSATLTVTAAGNPNTPIISVQPVNTTAVQNASTYMNCQASPSTQYDWYRDDVFVATTASPTFYVDTSIIGTFKYQVAIYNGAATAVSSPAYLTVTAPSGGTFPSYIGISGSSYGEDETTYFSVLASGAVEGTDTNGGGGGVFGWANPSGDGSLYEVMAVPNSSFPAQNGSAPRNVWLNVGNNPTWILQPPVKVGLSRFGSLQFTIRIISSQQVVTSGTINFENYRP